MLLRATVTDSAFGLEPWDSLLANKRRATKRGERTPHMPDGLGVETLDSGAAVSESVAAAVDSAVGSDPERRPLSRSDPNLEVRSSISRGSPSAVAKASRPVDSCAPCCGACEDEASTLAVLKASSGGVCEDEASDDSALAAEDRRPRRRQLELRREHRPTARETDARLRLNHEPSCMSPPVE